MEPQGRIGPGAFQWSWGGWFGSQIGATLWLVLLGTLLLAQGKAVGAVTIVWGVVPNIAGTWIWSRRKTLAPYPAIQGLIAICGVSALGAMLCMLASGDAIPDLPLPSGFWLLLMYPGLMLMFHLQESGARRRMSEGGDA